MKQVKLIGDHLMVRLDAEEEKFKDLIHIPEDARIVTRIGTVIGTGPGSERQTKRDKTIYHSKRIPTGFKKGDRVMVDWAKGVEWIDDQDNRYRIVKSDDCYAVVE